MIVLSAVYMVDVMTFQPDNRCSSPIYYAVFDPLLPLVFQGSI
jgi:hypothetical protein